MAELPPKETHQIEPEILQQLGFVIVSCARIERWVSDLFVALTEGDPGSMTVVTANVSQSSIADWIRTLLDIRQTPPDLANKIADVLTEVDELRAERNVLVHGMWLTTCPAGSVLVQTTRLERTEMIRTRVFTAPDLAVLVCDALRIEQELLHILRTVGVNG